MPRTERAAPDVIYPFRNIADGEELRLSLRSLVNLPHGRVWFVGDTPPAWVTGVGHIPTERDPVKYADANRNLLAACVDDRLTESVVLMNDDFYVMRPTRAVAPMHRGTVRSWMTGFKITSGPYLQNAKATARLLGKMGCADPLCFETHTPFAFRRAPMAELIRAGQAAGIAGLHHRTMYGNLHCPRAQLAEDVKVYKPALVLGMSWWPYLSTSNPAGRAGSPVAKFLRAAFPEPSPYEADVAVSVVA